MEVELPYDPAIPLLGINAKETRSEIGWFNLRGFAHVGTAVKMGRGMSDPDRHE